MEVRCAWAATSARSHGSHAPAVKENNVYGGRPHADGRGRSGASKFPSSRSATEPEPLRRNTQADSSIRPRNCQTSRLPLECFIALGCTAGAMSSARSRIKGRQRMVATLASRISPVGRNRCPGRVRRRSRQPENMFRPRDRLVTRPRQQSRNRSPPWPGKSPTAHHASETAKIGAAIAYWQRDAMLKC